MFWFLVECCSVLKPITEQQIDDVSWCVIKFCRKRFYQLNLYPRWHAWSLCRPPHPPAEAHFSANDHIQWFKFCPTLKEKVVEPTNDVVSFTWSPHGGNNCTYSGTRGHQTFFGSITDAMFWKLSSDVSKINIHCHFITRVSHDPCATLVKSKRNVVVVSWSYRRLLVTTA